MNKQHAPGFLRLVQAVKPHIHEIDASTLKAKIDTHETFHLIDVREEQEWHEGHIPTAIHLSKGIVERDIEKTIPDINSNVIVYCSGGFRAALVADNLQKMGYQHVASVKGGLTAWTEAKYPLKK